MVLLLAVHQVADVPDDRVPAAGFDESPVSSGPTAELGRET